MSEYQNILTALTEAKQPVLKLWNGHAANSMRKRSDARWRESRYVHVFIAAYSVADAVKLVAEYTGDDATGVAAHIRKYCSPVWGNSMKDITPERGMWVQFGDHAKPVRVI